MVTMDIKKAPEGTQSQTQYMINTLENLKKNLSDESKEVLKEVSNMIFNKVAPREYDEVTVLAIFEVCKMKMRLDNLDSHKIILSDFMTHTGIFKGVVCTS